MRTYSIILGVAVVLIAVLGGVAVHQNSQLDGEKSHSAELQKKVESLEQEVAALKETADYYFQQGVDRQSGGNLQEAKTTFEAIIAKFPTSALVASAKEHLAAVDAAIAKAEADRLAEVRRQQEEQERLVQERGEPIDFATLKAKIMAGTIEERKRYRFEARLWEDLTSMGRPDGPETQWIPTRAYYLNTDPDAKEAIMKQLAQKSDSVCTIVGSWGGALYGNQFVITDIEDCH